MPRGLTEDQSRHNGHWHVDTGSQDDGADGEEDVGDAHGPLSADLVGECAEDRRTENGTNGASSGDDLLFVRRQRGSTEIGPNHGKR